MKTTLRSALFLMLILSFCGFAFAWPACSGNWISVPAGTNNANGAVVTENGQTFQCQKPSDGAVNNNANSNLNNNSNTNNNTAVAVSTATGGAGGSVKDSGNSSIDNSGNSSNKNTNTANGGNATQGQKQGQQQEASANNSGGNSSNSYSSVSTYKAAANTAYAPTEIPTASCFKGYSAGGQGTGFGFSLGGGKIDKNCRALQTAVHATNRVTYCKLYIQLQDAKKAGVTMEDCMAMPAETPVQTPAPIVVAPVAPVVDVNPRPLQ